MTPRLVPIALAALLAGFSPLEADEEHVSEGNARLEAGDPAAALRSYAAAERAVGSRPEIDHDRGNAALAAGRPEEAKESWRRAAGRAAPWLASRALQNLGTALAAEGDRDGAARAFADALVKDPANEDARWNLEVLLRGGGRREPPPADATAPRPEATPPPPGERGAEDPGRAEAREREDAKEEGRTSAGWAAEPPATAEEQAAEPRSPAEAEAGEERDAAEPSRAARDEAGGPRREPLSRQEAEALLDALRAREKNMPFSSGERRREGRRGGAAKDW